MRKKKRERKKRKKKILEEKDNCLKAFTGTFPHLWHICLNFHINGSDKVFKRKFFMEHCQAISWTVLLFFVFVILSITWKWLLCKIVVDYFCKFIIRLHIPNVNIKPHANTKAWKSANAVSMQCDYELYHCVLLIETALRRMHCKNCNNKTNNKTLHHHDLIKEKAQLLIIFL